MGRVCGVCGRGLGRLASDSIVRVVFVRFVKPGQKRDPPYITPPDPQPWVP